MRKSKRRRFEGFGVVTRQGHFLWQYCRSTAKATQEAYQAHNPEVEGHPDGHKVVPLDLSLFD